MSQPVPAQSAARGAQLVAGRAAQRLEVSRQSVNAIETGEFDPSLPLAFKRSRLFEMPIEQIFPDEVLEIAGDRG